MISACRLISAYFVISIFYALPALSQISQGIATPSFLQLSRDERNAYFKFSTDERYWWISIQMLSWEDCMIAKGPFFQGVRQLSQEEVEAHLRQLSLVEVEARLGSGFSRDFFNAARIIGYYKPVLPMLDDTCQLPENASIHERAQRVASASLKEEANKIDQYNQQMKEENERLRRDIALQRTIMTAPFCSEQLNQVANSHKVSIYTIGKSLETSIGYAAVDQLLNNMTNTWVYRRYQCKPVLRPMPPAGF